VLCRNKPILPSSNNDGLDAGSRLVLNVNQLAFNPDGPGFTGRLIGTPERAYWIQSSTNFSQWQVVLTNQFGASNTFEFLENPTGTRKFLRALEADWFLRRTWATIEKNCGDLFRIAA